MACANALGADLMRGNARTVLPAVALVIMAVGFLAALGPARRSLRYGSSQRKRCGRNRHLWKGSGQSADANL
jgi:hypothetical protein